jgi:hypothetical protein
MHHFGFFNEPATPLDEQAKDNALLRIAVSGTGKIDPNRPYAAEAAIEDCKLAESLGIKLGEN